VLPVIGALGYDYTDPFVVQPEYAADFRQGVPERVDYAVMRDGNPIIAVECKKVGTDLSAGRGQLRDYFTALPSVHLGILTDGLRFEFFVDCEHANVMDEEPFLTLDLDAVTSGPIPGDVLEALNMLRCSNFRPAAVAEAAEMRLLAKRVRSVLMQEVREPSEDLCRLILLRVGMKNVRQASIQSCYSGLIRAAFEDALVLPVLEMVRASRAPEPDESQAAGSTTQRIVTTERELSIYRYVCRRLAFLSANEHEFSAIEQVQYRDYLGKFVVFYRSVNKGRLFDFIEGNNGYDRFIFAAPFGEIVTNAVLDIDEALRKTFAQRVAELGAPRVAPPRLSA
jgi:hypothetical protein